MRKKIKFIEGRYSPAEAADVLLSLINDKMKFHTVKLLNLRHEQAHPDRNSQERIESLKETRKIIEGLVLSAHENNLELEINSIIKIKLIDKSN